MEWNRDRFLNNLAVLTESKGLNQKDVEQECGMYPGYIAKMKAPMSTLKPSSDQLLALSSLFGYSIDEILKEDIVDVSADELYLRNLFARLEDNLAEDRHIWTEFSKETIEKMPEFGGTEYEKLEQIDLSEVDEVLFPINERYNEICNDSSIKRYIVAPDHDDSFPMLRCREDKDGNEKKYYDSFFHSTDCDIAGNAYRLQVGAFQSLYLIKVSNSGKQSLELYYHEFVLPFIEDLISYQDDPKMYKENADLMDENQLISILKPVCNTYNERITKMMVHLYNSIDKKLHRPKLTAQLRRDLDNIF